MKSLLNLIDKYNIDYEMHNKLFKNLFLISLENNHF